MEQHEKFEYILRLGDNALVLGQRLGEWCGHGPALEEDIALTNISLDLIGQARSLLDYAGQVEGAGRDEDKLAFFRDVRQYRNVILLEQPNGHFGDTIVRQFLYDHFAWLFYNELMKSNDDQLVAIAAKSIKEVTYHRRHSSEWIIRLGDGTAESKEKVQDSLDRLWVYSGEMLTPDSLDKKAQEAGIGVDLDVLKKDWHVNVKGVIEQANLTLPEDGWMHSGGKKGIHSEHLGYILAEMQHIPRAYPDAKW
ncbi:MAG: phenylacetate-CoA oxygenase subunit PaaC [Flavobacteriales bacterium]|nr:phenylacetate-CoA oxygenase subunit PaaC [Flavobacteriales bacterium]MDG1779700.1 phenylacetate-CoA oxygenase subunit PaaC [Flavobacteriales bacterium]